MLFQDKRILVTGGNGLVGSSLVEELKEQGYTDVISLTRNDCDLVKFDQVKDLFSQVKPDVVFHAAASVYGIGGNLKNKASVFLDNILMNTHVIEASRQIKVKKIVAMGTVAVYSEPKSLPIKEETIWDGPPHRSESSYGHAKRTMLAQLLAYQENEGLDFAYIVSTNLYGPNDKFDSQYGHVIPSLIRKFYEAKKNGTDVVIWGDGSAGRDFLFSKDMAKALILVLNRYSGPINVASGMTTKIREVVQFLSNYFEMDGKVKWDSKMPNGRNFSDVDLSKLNGLGFRSSYSIEEGLKETLEWFCHNYERNLVRC